MTALAKKRVGLVAASPFTRTDAQREAAKAWLADALAKASTPREREEAMQGYRTRLPVGWISDAYNEGIDDMVRGLVRGLA